MPIQVRALRTRDLFTVARIAKGASGPVRAAMQSAVVTAQRTNAEGETETQIVVDQQALGFVVLEALVEQEEPIMAFLADLVGMTPEVFGETGLATIPEIIEALREDEDLPRFLSQVVALVSGVSSTAATASSPATAGLPKKSKRSR